MPAITPPSTEVPLIQQPEAQTTSGPDPLPYYSASDKDRVSEMLHEIHEVLEKQVKPNEQSAHKVRRMWEPSDRLERLPQMIEELSRVEDEIRNQHQKLNSDIRKRYQRYEKIFAKVAGDQVLISMSELANEVRNYRENMQFTSDIFNALDDSELAGKLVHLNNASMRCFRDKSAKLSGYVEDCIKRIRATEHELLGR